MINNIMDYPYIQFTQLYKDAIRPTRADSNPAGFDLYASSDTLIIGGNGNVFVPAGIAATLPENTYCRVILDPEIAKQHHLVIATGTINIADNDEIGVLVSCTKLFDAESIKVPRGDPVNPLHLNHGKECLKQRGGNGVSAYNYYHSMIRNELRKEDDGEKLYPCFNPYFYVIEEGTKFATLILEKPCFK